MYVRWWCVNGRGKGERQRIYNNNFVTLWQKAFKRVEKKLVMWKWFCPFPNPFVPICFPYIVWYWKHPLISGKNGHICASRPGSSPRKFVNKLILGKHLPVHSGSVSHLFLPHDFHHLRRYFEGSKIWQCNKAGSSADSNQHSNSVTVKGLKYSWRDNSRKCY